MLLDIQFKISANTIIWDFGRINEGLISSKFHKIKTIPSISRTATVMEAKPVSFPPSLSTELAGFAVSCPSRLSASLINWLPELCSLKISSISKSSLEFIIKNVVFLNVINVNMRNLPPFLFVLSLGKN